MKIIFYIVVFVVSGAAAAVFLPAYGYEIHQIPETILAEVTMYNPVAEQTDADPDIAASGKRVHGYMAACPAWLSFGTLLRVSGQIYVCEDRMALRYRHGNFIDLLTFDKEKAVQFGRQKLVVAIVSR